MVSESVGWGWMVSSRSLATAPISIAKVASATRLPALLPANSAPRSLSFSELMISNIKYSGAIEGEDEISRDNFNTLDYGIGAGVALNFGIVQAGIRYNLGLQKIAKTDIANLLLGDSKNAYGQLYIAFRLYE